MKQGKLKKCVFKSLKQIEVWFEKYKQTKPTKTSKATFNLINLCPVHFLTVKDSVKRQFTVAPVQCPLKSVERFPVPLPFVYD